MSDPKLMVHLNDEIRALVAEILEMEPEEVSMEAHFVKDLGMDSMMALEILASIEKKYKIVIPEEALPKFTDLNTTIEIVSGIMGKSSKRNR